MPRCDWCDQPATNTAATIASRSGQPAIRITIRACDTHAADIPGRIAALLELEHQLDQLPDADPNRRPEQ